MTEKYRGTPATRARTRKEIAPNPLATPKQLTYVNDLARQCLELSLFGPTRNFTRLEWTDKPTMSQVGPLIAELTAILKAEEGKYVNDEEKNRMCVSKQIYNAFGELPVVLKYTFKPLKYEMTFWDIELEAAQMDAEIRA